WIDEHAGAAAALAAPPPVPAESSTPPPVPPAPAPVFGADGAVELARFARAKLTAARPIELDAEGLRVSLEGGREARVAWSRIQAVAVAIVADLAAKPVLLIDLLANWNASEAEELKGIRLRSDQFDPRALLGIEGDPR